jgi:hypothetical protein
MTGAVALRSNYLPIARVKRLGVAGRKADGDLPENAIRRAGSDTRIDIACRSGALADKAALQTIGLLMLLATLFVFVAGAFAVNYQLSANAPPDLTTYGIRNPEHIGSCGRPHVGPTVSSGCPDTLNKPRNFLM